MQQPTTAITVIGSTGCHLCADARSALEEIDTHHRLVIRYVDAGSPEGLELVARHRPALQPLVLVNGERFSVGRLPRRKLERLLEARAHAAVVAP